MKGQQNPAAKALTARMIVLRLKIKRRQNRRLRDAAAISKMASDLDMLERQRVLLWADK